MSFATQPLHFNRLLEQVDIGLYVVKRTAAYLTKVTAAQVAFVKEIEKVTKHEELKMKDIRNDVMFQHVAASVLVQDLVSGVTKRHQAFADALNISVIKPMHDFFTKGEERRKKIITEEAKLQANVLSLKTSLLKERKECFKTFQECVDIKSEVEAEERKDPKKANVEKVKTKLEKARSKAKQSFQKYEQHREAFRLAVEEYRTASLPRILSDLQQMEEDRLNTIKLYLTHFATLFNEMTADMPQAAKFTEQMDRLDAKPEMNAFVNSLQGQEGKANPALETVDLEIPCSSAFIETDSWYQGDSKSGNRTAPPDSPRPAANSASSEAKLSVPEHSRNSSHARTFSADEPPARAAPPAIPAKPSTSPTSAAAASASSDQLHVRSLYAFEEDVQPGDLRFDAGEVIKIVDRSDPAWWVGESLQTGRSGRIPTNFVEAIPADKVASAIAAASGAKSAATTPAAAPPPVPVAAPAAAAPAHSDKLVVQTLYDYRYEPVGDPAVDDLGYISFAPGDSIVVSSKDDPVWWHGTLQSTGQSGYFPCSHVNTGGL